jgi:hypothetical protein
MGKDSNSARFAVDTNTTSPLDTIYPPAAPDHALWRRQYEANPTENPLLFPQARSSAVCYHLGTSTLAVFSLVLALCRASKELGRRVHKFILYQDAAGCDLEDAKGPYVANRRIQEAVVDIAVEIVVKTTDSLAVCFLISPRQVLAWWICSNFNRVIRGAIGGDEHLAT